MFFCAKKYNLFLGDAETSGGRDGRRPASARSVDGGGASLVERRLRVVGRSRAQRPHGALRAPAAGLQRAPSTTPSTPEVSAAPAKPPCAAYPAFDMSRLPNDEQGILDAVVMEIVDAVVFSSLPSGQM